MDQDERVGSVAKKRRKPGISPTQRSLAYSKYSNKKTLAHGKLFASKREAKRYGELMLLQRAGEILALETQPVIACEVKGHHVCNYIADFRYRKRSGFMVVEDVKGYKTDVYRLKKKLVKACTGIEIQEV